MALAALEYGVIEPETTRLCRGAWQFPGSSHRYRDWKKGGHGSVDMHWAIAQSCDVYFYGVSDQLGIDRMHDFLVQFGLGSPTGIDILGERSGLVPSTDWKKKAFKKKSLQVWFPGETVIAGIGQGYMLATPLQLAHVAATIATRGKRFAAAARAGVRDSVTGEVRELPPRPAAGRQGQGPRPLGRDHRRHGRRDEPGRHRVPSQAGAPYQIAGKTGTAQVFTVGQNEKYNEAEVAERLRDHALFIAFAPADAPKLAVAVLVENGRSGSGTAAPIARKVFDAFLLPRPPAGAARLRRRAAPPQEREE